MTSRAFEIVVFEALALFPLLWPRLRADALTREVMASVSGQRARRILHIVVAVMAAGGGLLIAFLPDELLFPWTFGMLVMIPTTVGAAFVEWLRRAVLSLKGEQRNRTVVLNLEEEKMPGVVWLAAVPPVLTLGLIFWLADHWSVLPVRETGLPPRTAWRDPAFQSIAQFLFFDLGWSVWFWLCALAVWHGMSRRYTFRRSQLAALVATSWSTALLTPALTLPLLLRLPPIGLVLCLAAGAFGIGLFIVFARRARRDVATASMPPSSYAFYFDRNDPSAFGDRGVNLGSPWNWALFAAPAVFFALPAFLSVMSL
jgi:hypothetical protein